MRKWIAPLAVVAMFALTGCENMNRDKDMHHDDMNKSGMKSDNKMNSGTMNNSGSMNNEPKKMMTDDCSHCAGQQTATADGKCPMCGMKVK